MKRRFFKFIFILFITFVCQNGFSSSLEGRPDDALVVASNRIGGHLSETARYCVADCEEKFFHFNLGKTVTSIDKLPLLGGMFPSCVLPKGHGHIAADARTYKGFRKNQFDLIFMELPSSCLTHDIPRHETLEREGNRYKYISVIPEIIKNLASSLKSGGYLEIEHLPLSCMLRSHESCLDSSDSKGLSNIESLIRKDPFTIFHTEFFFMFMEGWKNFEPKKLKALLSDKKSILSNRDAFVHVFSAKENLSSIGKKALAAEMRHLDYLHEAIQFRARKESVFPEVIINLMVHELRNEFHSSPNSYFRMIFIYAHLLDLRANIGPLEAILKPLGFVDVRVKVKKESYNGRVNPWFIVARKKQPQKPSNQKIFPQQDQN
jgi:hypothetical protein